MRGRTAGNGLTGRAVAMIEDQKKPLRDLSSFNPNEDVFRELLVFGLFWGLFWTIIAGFGWLAFTVVSASATRSGVVIPYPWPGVIGTAAAYVVALTLMVLSDKKSGVVRRVFWPSLHMIVSRFTSILTLVVGVLIGEYFANHSEQAVAARWVATACARISGCPDFAARISTSDVDIQGYIISTAR